MVARWLLVGACCAAGVAAAADDDTLAEVVVTAHRRAENVQDVAGSIAALDARTLQDLRIQSVDDLAANIASFTMSRFNVAEPQMYLRGMGSNTDSAGSDPSVGVFLDEVYVGRVSGASFELLDLERVEVLRGPQSLLYGRNTSAGAIVLAPRLPQRQFEAESTVTLGNYDLREMSAFIGGPLGEDSAGRLAVLARDRGGYSRNITTGADLDDDTTLAARLQWQTQLGEATRLRLSIDGTRDRSGGNARVPGPLFTDQVGTDAIATAALLRIWPLGSDVRHSYSGPQSDERRDILGGLVRLEHDTSHGTFTALGSVRQVELDWFEDLDGVKPFGLPPLPGVPPAAQGWVFASTDVAHERARQGSLELRYASPVTDRVSWLAGLYHFSEDVDRDEDFVTRFSLMPAAGGNVSFLQDAGGSSQAVYGLVRAGLTTQLELEAGLRYTHDHKSIHQVARNNDAADAVPGIPLFPGQPYDIRAGDTWNPLTGQLGLNYRPLPTMLVYGNVARGFKAGAFPSQNNVVQNVAQATPAERVLSTELGVKAEWLERRLRTNLAVFDTDAQDLQLFRLDPQLRLLTFTEDASIRGIELDLAAIPLPGLQLGLTGSLLHARVDGGSNAGDALPRAPDAKFAARVQYGRAVAQGRAELGLVYQWTDSFETDVPNTRIMHVAGYHLIDARLAWTDAAGNLEVAAWGRNLGDVDHVVHTIAFLGNGFSLYGAPRTYGLSVTYRIH